MTSAIRSFSEKVVEEVQEKLLGPSPAQPKRRVGWEATPEGDINANRPTSNKAVVWTGPKKVELKDVGYPAMRTPQGAPIEHGVVLKVVVTAICGSDLHMYRGSIPGVKPGMVFGHEITGEVFEMGNDVERFEIGDVVSVPFNISCGRCDNDREGMTNACLRVNPEQPGSAYGYAMMGGWQGGQAEYVLVPYADHQLIKIPKEAVMPNIESLAMLTDIFPTGYNGAVQAGVKCGSIVYVAGAGPVGLCAAQSCFLLGAAEVFISDQNEERLHLAQQIGCKTIHLAKLSGGKHDADAVYKEIERQLPPWKNGPHQLVDCSIDCVGYEACGLGKESTTRIDETVLNTCFRVTKAGGKIGIPGLYPPADLQGANADNKAGVYHLRFGECWTKGLTLAMGQCPVLAHQKDLLKLILHGRVELGRLLNVRLIGLDQAPAAFDKFNQGEPCKFLIDPHGMVAKAQAEAMAQQKPPAEAKEQTKAGI